MAAQGKIMHIGDMGDELSGSVRLCGRIKKYGSIPGLANMERLCRRLGDPRMD